jgi:hypothetical protein
VFATLKKRVNLHCSALEIQKKIVDLSHIYLAVSAKSDKGAGNIDLTEFLLDIKSFEPFWI